MRLVRHGDRIINLGYVVLAEWDGLSQNLTVHFATHPAPVPGYAQTPDPAPAHFVRTFTGPDAEAVWAKLSKDAV